MDSDNRLIAEFERHHGTIVMYPFRKDIWRDNAYYMRKYGKNPHPTNPPS